MVEMPQTEAENAIATGFGRLAAEPPSAKRSSRRKAVAPVADTTSAPAPEATATPAADAAAAPAAEEKAE